MPNHYDFSALEYPLGRGALLGVEAANALAKPLMLLTARDTEILEALTNRVRVLTLTQVARTWWQEAKPETAAGRLRALAEEGLLQIARRPAHPEVALDAPVATWRPGETVPDLGAVSFRLQSRWKNHPVLTTTITATKLAALRFGGHSGRPPRDVELTHDIHLAAVFLLYRNRHPELIPHWVFEEQAKAERKRLRTPRGEKLPDVHLRAPSGVRVVEFGGGYSKEKLRLFHAHCAEHALPYEIW